MRKSTVKLGLNSIIAGIVSVILASYFHQSIADLFHLSPPAEARFVFLGLFCGGFFGGLGVLLSVIGLLRRPSPQPKTHLAPSLIILVVVTVLFFILFFSFFNSFVPQQMQPGETITI
jgi:membrane-bound ClpP family serine protease